MAQRCEANYRLDSGSLALYELAASHAALVRLQMAWSKVLLFEQDKALEAILFAYAEATGRELFDDSLVDAAALLGVLQPCTLGRAYARSRNIF